MPDFMTRSGCGCMVRAMLVPPGRPAGHQPKQSHRGQLVTSSSPEDHCSMAPGGRRGGFLSPFISSALLPAGVGGNRLGHRLLSRMPSSQPLQPRGPGLMQRERERERERKRDREREREREQRRLGK
ncbi:hypothetical protein LY76DRAFT_304499 [Colletotrichum caudatum]|nr:hypothetical protein LY76DRAFT_304499 [Colletotrichum caudatum]